MLIQTLTSERSAVSKGIKRFGRDLKSRPLSLRRSNNLFFLCGANTHTNEPSARRKAIKRFIEAQSSDFKVIYAENVFNEIAQMGPRKNALDIEHDISLIADKILIILESESSFCELGAFAHQALRKNLIVINDSRFQKHDSFINSGPLDAMKEVGAPILWYPMSSHGIDVTDGIGATFQELSLELARLVAQPVRRVRGDLSALDHNKDSLYFVHDLVFFTGPITQKELIHVLIQGFGNKSYDNLKHLLGMLKAASLIRSTGPSPNGAFASVSSKPFFTYSFDTNPLIAAFRRFHLRYNATRFTNG